MTLAEIAATCPNWRNQCAPRPRRARKGPTQVADHRAPVDYRALWQKRRHWELAPARAANKARYGRSYRQRHREEILERLRRKRAAGIWKVSRKGRRA